MCRKIAMLQQPHQQCGLLFFGAATSSAVRSSIFGRHYSQLHAEQAYRGGAQLHRWAQGSWDEENRRSVSSAQSRKHACMLLQEKLLQYCFLNV